MEATMEPIELLMLVVLMFAFWMAVAGGGMIYEDWLEYYRAAKAADDYLYCVEDEIADRVKAYDGSLPKLRGLLYDYDKREKLVSRPAHAWALIPYALEIHERLPDLAKQA